MTAEIVVSVRDDGVGFRYDEERLRREGKLGMLRSMKGRIEALGGSMRVVSMPGPGTEVEFRLPAQVRRTMTTEPEPGEPIRVMVVDDHPIWRDAVSTDLDRSGVATVVAQAADGGEAIEPRAKRCRT